MFRFTGTVYTFGFLLMTIKYFFSGPPDKSNRARQRARLVHAYSLTLCALVCPVLVSPLLGESFEEGELSQVVSAGEQ